MKTAVYPPRLSILGLAACLLAVMPSLQAAPGDISVTLLDMANQPLAGSQGAKATLWGVDDNGFRTIDTKTPDASGHLIFTAQSIQSAQVGAFHFVVDATTGTNGLRAHLYDPYGQSSTFIRYQTDRGYDFTLPVPTWGSAAPEVFWNGAQSQFRFHVDLGNRSGADFWFVRVILQQKAPNAGFADGNFGLTPVISIKWLSDQGYTMDDGGLAPNQTGSIRIRRTGYDQTFLAKKILPAGSMNAQYLVYLVNSLWGKDLLATYDRTHKLCVAAFDPANLFTDTNAPAWDGFGMKTGVPYYATLQAQAWFWHEAGANQGLAIDWGGGVSPSLFHPVQALRLEPVGKSETAFTIRVFGSAGLTYILESRGDLRSTIPWVPLQSVQASSLPFLLTDTNAVASPRFYRIRQD